MIRRPPRSTLDRSSAASDVYRDRGKAQNYLEASLSVEPGHKAHFALAQLNEKLGKHELAMNHYNKGLGLTLKQLS